MGEEGPADEAPFICSECRNAKLWMCQWQCIVHPTSIIYEVSLALGLVCQLACVGIPPLNPGNRWLLRWVRLGRLSARQENGAPKPSP